MRLAAVAALATLAACSEQGGIVEPVTPPGGTPSALLIPTTGTYFDLAARYNIACAIRLDGVVECWGENLWGAAPATRTAGAGTFTDVSTSGFHSCAVRSDGKMECWGRSDYGEAPALRTPPAGATFTGVATGTGYTCGLLSNGTVQCWGFNDIGQAPPTWNATNGSFTTVSATGSNTCALNTTGVIECFGLAEQESPFQFVAVGSSGFVKVVTTAGTVCGLRTDLVVQCKGPFPSGFALPLGRTFTDFDVNFVTGAHWCGVRADGVVECGGDNALGQAPAMRTASVGSYIRVVVGADQSCALRTDNRLECWGNADHGGFTRILPTATFSAPASVIVGQPIPLSLSGAQVPGQPSATVFTYAFDCGAGFGTAGSVATASCATSTTGVRTVRGRVIDQEGDSRSYSALVTIKSAGQGTTDLRAAVSTASLSPDLRNALSAKLNAAIKAIESGKTQTACSALSDFINQVNAQRGKAIPIATADAWLATARALQQAIGC